MRRYNIEETAVYDKYVRWCGRTGPRGPSYPISRLSRRLDPQKSGSAGRILNDAEHYYRGQRF
jgi:hypothetical protein